MTLMTQQSEPQKVSETPNIVDTSTPPTTGPKTTSPAMQHYFDTITTEVHRAHKLATKARTKGIDPTQTVEISLAKNMAERVVGLISVIAPALQNSGVVERIIELEKEYGPLDWRVALKIAEEIAAQKFCKFDDTKKAIDVGIRTGFAYSTVGVVSSPLDGIINIEFKQRMDGKGEYICINYAGPIRNAGGTNAAVSVLIGDYVRKKMGYAAYDATPEEAKRAVTELQDYQDRVTNLQFHPSNEEMDFLLKNMPVEIGADASENFEVSNYKDLPRVPINKVRSGYCLMYSGCIPLKAPKLWNQLSKWGAQFGMEHWNFLQEFIAIQKKAKSRDAPQKTEGLAPDYTFLHDLVAGRPVFSHPLRSGGFRLRYGRSRTSGFSACSLHPATMVISNEYLGIGTQLKHERPSKGCVVSSCDTIEGPIVKLNDGSVLQLTTSAQAREYKGMIQEIIYIGDLLISFGDFANRAHSTVPAGYCPEWWAQELQKHMTKEGILDTAALSQVGIIQEQYEELVTHPTTTHISADKALSLAHIGIPLHPSWTYYWTSITPEQLLELTRWLHQPLQTTTNETILATTDAKRTLELLGVPHVISVGTVHIAADHARILCQCLALSKPLPELEQLIQTHTGNTLARVSALAGFTIRDKAGTFIGARMGRPEKAKMRELIGSPHTLFPVGEEGGKYRSIQNCLLAKKIITQVPQYLCTTCTTKTVFSSCLTCNTITTKLWNCKICGWIATETCMLHNETRTSARETINIVPLFEQVLKKIGMEMYPDLIKGVRGTSNKDHTPEHLGKGVLRAKHDIHVNKDGTARYDMTQMPITHFKPKEIRTPIARLIELGYTTDMHGKPLEHENQICEIKPQDIILPSCPASPDEPADAVLQRVANFIDNELKSLYGIEQFYFAKTSQDLVGHLVIALAPHTSAGIVGRIIGFSKTQGLLAHPLLHAATRRDCDGDEACVVLLMDAFLNFSKSFLPETRGSTMDAPLVLTTILVPGEVDDMVFDLDIPSRYPLELYELAQLMNAPRDIPGIKMLKSCLAKPQQYEGMRFTHDTTDLNDGVLCSAYKTLPSMEEKLRGQMDLAERIRAVDTADVARLVIEKHFIRDAKGNLRKFSTQEVRCVNCNEKFRRPPLSGKCTECKSKLIFTISEGNINKYVEPMASLANHYHLSAYLRQTIQLLQRRIESVFGREKEKQTGLGAWFG